MTWKTHSVPWDKWVEFCAEWDENPYEIADLSFEYPGGGDGYTVMCHDDPPERGEDAEIKD